MPGNYKEVNLDQALDEEIMSDKEALLSNFHAKSTTRFMKYLEHISGSRSSEIQFSETSDSLCTNHNELSGYLRHRPILIHLLLVAMYSAFYLIVLIRVNKPPDIHRVIYTPAEPAIYLEAKPLDVRINKTSNIYNGKPSPELDQAWDALFHHANIRVSPEEIDRLGRSSIELADGSGDYFGTLDVYHQIHCLKYIRHYIHQDYYTLPTTNVPNVEHVNHCIEMLRQVIMCKADIALMTYEWLPDFPGPWPNFGIQHECLNWDKVDSWSKDRSIDIFNPKYLQHPKFGFSYSHLADLPKNRTYEQ